MMSMEHFFAMEVIYDFLSVFAFCVSLNLNCPLEDCY